VPLDTSIDTAAVSLLRLHHSLHATASHSMMLLPAPTHLKLERVDSPVVSANAEGNIAGQSTVLLMWWRLEAHRLAAHKGAIHHRLAPG